MTALTLVELCNQRSESEKKALKDMIDHKIETCEMWGPYLRAKGYSEKEITWMLQRM